MEQPGIHGERRKHPRAPVRLPARIRWQGPLGLRVELTETIDVSRDGVLVHRHEACAPHSRVWIVFPTDRAGASAEPEIPGRVTRVVQDEDKSYWVGIRLESPERSTSRLAGEERRRAKRLAFALPIFVRVVGMPWPEELMTHDLSSIGVRFETSHVYNAGDAVTARIPWGDWSKRGQIRGRVVRVENLPDAADQASASNLRSSPSANIMSVAVEWLGGTAPAGPTKP